MKKIILVFMTMLIVSFTPKRKEKSLRYFYINKKSFIGAYFGYKAYFSIKSIDANFKRDNYYFKIEFPDLDQHSLYSLGKEIDIDTVSYIDPQKYFLNKSNCKVHEELSIEKNFMIITQNPKSNKEIVFFARYVGTDKDIVYSSLGFRDIKPCTTYKK